MLLIVFVYILALRQAQCDNALVIVFVYILALRQAQCDKLLLIVFVVKSVFVLSGITIKYCGVSLSLSKTVSVRYLSTLTL